MDKYTADILNALQQRNLVYNSNFLYYSNKETKDSLTTYNHPDGWVYNDSGENKEIGFNLETSSCLIQKSSDDSKMTFKQVISEFPRWKTTLKEKKVSACAIILNPKSSAKNFKLTFSINDGVSNNSKTIVLSPGETTSVSLDLNIDAEPLILELSIESSTKSAIIYIQKVYANIGNISLETLPCMVQGVIGERKQYITTENPPAEELSLCNDKVDLSEDFTRLRSVINNRFGINEENGNPYLISMAGYFSRAWNNGAKIDGVNIDPNADERTAPDGGTITGDNVSTFESDAFLKHKHGLEFSVGSAQSTTGGTGPNTNLVTPVKSNTNEALDGKETRPKNIAELYTIKWA